MEAALSRIRMGQDKNQKLLQKIVYLFFECPKISGNRSYSHKVIHNLNSSTAKVLWIWVLRFEKVRYLLHTITLHLRVFLELLNVSPQGKRSPAKSRKKLKLCINTYVSHRFPPWTWHILWQGHILSTDWARETPMDYKVHHVSKGIRGWPHE